MAKLVTIKLATTKKILVKLVMNKLFFMELQEEMLSSVDLCKNIIK